MEKKESHDDRLRRHYLMEHDGRIDSRREAKDSVETSGGKAMIFPAFRQPAA